LSVAEKAWLAALQEVLDSCPSTRLGFYTIGDRVVQVFDKRKEAQINKMMDESEATDFCVAAHRLGAGICGLQFPSNVHSTAG
jgi:ATP-dependent Clp protease adapter protein ClpS